MEFYLICFAAISAAALTLFSGFGLGTLLMPVFAIFFPLNTAIAMTAMVHLANNLFKTALLGRKADLRILIRFGLPAVLAAFAGAVLLSWFGDIRPIYQYQVFENTYQISPVKLVIGLLIIFFVMMELTPYFSKIAIDLKYLPLGGVISGFFGGLSGHQGAFRSMFLLKAGLNKEVFVATSCVIAVMVDLARMTSYGLDHAMQQKDMEWTLILAAMLSAFAGTYIGSRLLQKVTIRFVRLIVSILLTGIALGLITGVL